MASVADGYNGGGVVGVAQLSQSAPTFTAAFDTISNTCANGVTMGYASLWHTASSTKVIHIRRVWLTFQSVATLCNIAVSLKRWNTTAPAGGAAVTPAPADPSDTVESYTAFQTNSGDPWSGSTAPTFASTGPLVDYWFRNAAFTTGSSGAAPGWGDGTTVYRYEQSVQKPITLRAGVLEGVMLCLDVDALPGASSLIKVGGGFTWTEE